MAQNSSRVPFKETNNFKQGKDGAKVPTKPGPAKGRKGVENPTKGGGIYRPTRGGSSY